MNQVWPSALDAFLRADIDILTEPLVLQPLTAAYTYDAAHTALADLGALVYPDASLVVTSIAAGAVYVDPVVFPALAAGPAPITAVAALVADVVDASAPGDLIAFIDTRADATPLDVTPDGTDLTFAWPRLFRL